MRFYLDTTFTNKGDTVYAIIKTVKELSVDDYKNLTDHFNDYFVIILTLLGIALTIMTIIFPIVIELIRRKQLKNEIKEIELGIDNRLEIFIEKKITPKLFELDAAIYQVQALSLTGAAKFHSLLESFKLYAKTQDSKNSEIVINSLIELIDGKHVSFNQVLMFHKKFNPDSYINNLKENSTFYNLYKAEIDKISLFFKT